MPAWSMINGVWRKMRSNATLINGVWRNNNNFMTVNSVVRSIHNHEISEDEILGFKVIYKLSHTMTHPNYPNLSFNNDIPATLSLTGSNIGVMDTSKKGVLYQYSNKYPDIEGIKMYEGTLYAILLDESYINIGKKVDESDSDEEWSGSRFSNTVIEIDGRILFEDNGYFIDGWNSLFTKINYLDKSYFPNKDYNSYIKPLLNHKIYPIGARDNDFGSIAKIGIARDMSTSKKNMVGSYGLLDHTISSIKVNGIIKPFVIEIYD